MVSACWGQLCSLPCRGWACSTCPASATKAASSSRAIRLTTPAGPKPIARCKLPAFLGKKPQHFAGKLIRESEPCLGPRVKIDRPLIQPDHRRLPPPVLRPCKIIGRMSRNSLALVERVVIQRQALARLSRGASQRIRKPVQRALIGCENERMVQQRRILHRASRHLSILPRPQFNGSSPLFLPFTIQIEDQIHAPLPVPVEVGH